MTYKEIIYKVEDDVLTITLNRPEHLNALTVSMADEIIAAFDAADADDAIRAIIVTGAGRAFCAGADLGNGAETFNLDAHGYDAASKPRDVGGLITLRIFQSLKPVIGAINGPAVGFGLTFTLAMDVRVLSTSAKLGFVFAKRGIVPDGCASWFLPRIVGISKAIEWVATGRVFGADEALAANLVKSVHQPGEELAAAKALAREIADNTAPVSVALSRQMLWRMLGAPHPMDGHRSESWALASRGQSADAREGVMSFLEKRPAHFTDLISAGLPEAFPGWIEPQY